MQKIDEEELKKHVGDRLKLFILSKNKLQREFAEKFDITVGVYNGYETGRRSFPYPHLKMMHDLGCSLDWLIGGKGEMLLDSNKSDRSLCEKAALEAQKVQTDLLYASTKRPDKEAMIQAYSDTVSRLVNFYSDLEKYSRNEILEKYQMCIKPLKDLF